VPEALGHLGRRERILAQEQDVAELDVLQFVLALGQRADQRLGNGRIARVVDPVAALNSLDRLLGCLELGLVVVEPVHGAALFLEKLVE
jgi:hypothetical protein